MMKYNSHFNSNEHCCKHLWDSATTYYFWASSPDLKTIYIYVRHSATI
jgi:hypothetical protein